MSNSSARALPPGGSPWSPAAAPRPPLLQIRPLPPGAPAAGGFSLFPPWPRRLGRRWPASPLGMKVFRRKALVLCAGYALLLLLTMLNLLDYKWHKEPPQQCRGEPPGAAPPPARQAGSQARPDLRSLYRAPAAAAVPGGAGPGAGGGGGNSSGPGSSSGPGPGPRKRQLVYVFTTWRSGSSFFGELFNQNPEVFFLYEPVWHVWQKLYPGDAVSLQGAARDMLSALYRCDLSVFQLYSPAGSGGRNLTTLGIFGAATNKVVCSSPLCPAYRKEVVGLVDDRVCKKCPPQRLARFEEECRKYRTLVIKGVRVFDVAVLAPLLRDPALDLKVIHLVRDPRAVASSRIRSRHGLIRESLQVVRSRDPRAHRMPFLEAAGHKLGGKKEGLGSGPADYHALGAMEVICNSMAKTLQTALQPPDWLRDHYLVVRYEDLVGDPVKTLRRVYDFVGLLVSPEMEQFALNMTSGSGSSSKPFVVSARNATQAANAWRAALTFQQIKQVEEFCYQPMAVLGYERVNSPEEVKDLSKTLLRKPRL
ncbi:carbohydrate sulfotransferase 2 [Vombatus ursinus]|uniref:Sulfotransferase n=1 Tax=Vombatus ursinus TaxID=29139 RepID=A0A4X2KWU0_VOMUR|nr:carbohydrate sulfotransferase 2 [Vombatus ursinus]